MKYFSFVITLLIAAGIAENSSSQDVKYPDPERYSRVIQRFEDWDSKNSYPQNSVLFVGSSSVRRWPTANAFGQEFPVLNRGFGGSYMADSVYHANALILQYKPAVVVVYAGDNDVWNGIPAELIYQDFVQLAQAIHTTLPRTEVVCLAVKPSQRRWSVWSEMQEVNRRLSEFASEQDSITFVDVANPLLGENGLPDPALFVDDELHLSQAGYKKWNSILTPVLRQRYAQATTKKPH